MCHSTWLTGRFDCFLFHLNFSSNYKISNSGKPNHTQSKLVYIICCFAFIENFTIRLPNECAFFSFYRWNCRVPMGPVQISMNENISMHPTQYNSTESINPMRVPQNNCDLSTSIFNPNLYGGQTSGTSTTIQNPFDCDPNTIRSISSIRNPLSTFGPTYQSQNGYMSTGPMQTFGAVMNPIQAAHSSTQQQQTISYNQTSFFLPIQGNNSINAAYFNSNDQNSRVNYDFTLWICKSIQLHTKSLVTYFFF